MTLPQLKQLVAQGEGQFLEFKNRVPDPIRLVRELVAFANGKGGILLVGIDDNGDIIGVKDRLEERFAIDEALVTNCSDELNILFSEVSISKKRSVLVLHVKEQGRKPVYVVDGQQKVVTIRVADKAVDASREMRRILKHQSSKNDVSFIYGDKEKLLMAYLEDHESVTVEQFAKMADIRTSLASQTLVLLSKADILEIRPGLKGVDSFVLGRKGSE